MDDTRTRARPLGTARTMLYERLQSLVHSEIDKRQSSSFNEINAFDKLTKHECSVKKEEVKKFILLLVLILAQRFASMATNSAALPLHEEM